MTPLPAAAFDPKALGRSYDVPAVRQQRARTLALLGATPTDTVLDLGCGPGHLTTELAGTGTRVVAVDLDEAMLRATAARADGAGVRGRCRLLAAEATGLPLTSSSVDGAAVVQVLEYVPDVERALRELHRVLKPGGRAVLVDTDWRSCVWHTDDRHRTDEVLRRWEGHFVHPHLPAALPALAHAAGFVNVEVHAVPVLETDTRSDTYGVGMSATIARFVGRSDQELADGWRADVRRQAVQGTAFFSLTRYAATVTRGAST